MPNDPPTPETKECAECCEEIVDTDAYVHCSKCDCVLHDYCALYSEATEYKASCNDCYPDCKDGAK